MGGTGDVQCSLLMTEVHLHIDDEEMSVGGVFGGGGEVGLGRLLGKGGDIGIEEGADARGVVGRRGIGHIRFQKA